MEGWFYVWKSVDFPDERITGTIVLTVPPVPLGTGLDQTALIAVTTIEMKPCFVCLESVAPNRMFSPSRQEFYPYC